MQPQERLWPPSWQRHLIFYGLSLYLEFVFHSKEIWLCNLRIMVASVFVGLPLNKLYYISLKIMRALLQTSFLYIGGYMYTHVTDCLIICIETSHAYVGSTVCVCSMEIQGRLMNNVDCRDMSFFTCIKDSEHLCDIFANTLYYTRLVEICLANGFIYSLTYVPTLSPTPIFCYLLYSVSVTAAQGVPAKML